MRFLSLALAAFFAAAFMGCGNQLPTPMPVSQAPTPASISNLNLQMAYSHLHEVMDQFHRTFDVYTDIGSAGNHFVHRVKMFSPGTKDTISIDEAHTEGCYSGATCIKNSFSAHGVNWAGVYFQNEVPLSGGAKSRSNWSEYSNAGYDLRGATELTFLARGGQGKERVEFFGFGVGRDPLRGNLVDLKLYPHRDSEAKVTPCGRLVSPCYITLDKTWRQYKIRLTGLDLSYVIGGFGWVTEASKNNNQGITFYLDDIRYNKPRLDEPRFPVSYQTIPSDQAFDAAFKNVAFTYDIALALSAFTSAGDCKRAGLLADALLYVREHDRYYSDGRLRNTYQAGDLVSSPGWQSSGGSDTIGISDGWNTPEQRWHENREFVGSGTGNLAWAMISLLNHYETCGGDQYLTAAIALGHWVVAHTQDTRGAGGYTGGYTGWKLNSTKLIWKSTEHNLNLYVAFERLYQTTGEDAWRQRSRHARSFVEAMWNKDEGFYWTGTLDNGITVNRQVIPLDAQTLSLLAFGPNALTRRAITYAERHYSTSYDGYDGFDFNSDRDMPWPEGTAQAVVAYWVSGEPDRAQFYLNELRAVQLTAHNGNRKGIVAAPANGLTTGFDSLYFNRLHVGATAWFIFAEEKYNPYWNTRTFAATTTSTPRIVP